MNVIINKCSVKDNTYTITFKGLFSSGYDNKETEITLSGGEVTLKIDYLSEKQKKTLASTLAKNFGMGPYDKKEVKEIFKSKVKGSQIVIG